MKLTIPIPVHNTPAHHLLEAYYSIKTQNPGNEHRIVIVDDHSDNPETLRALRMLRAEVEVRRTRRVLGLAGCLNWIHKTAETEYIARMDSDDISHPGRLSAQIEYLKENPGTDVLGTNLFAFLDQSITRKPLFTTEHPEIAEAKKSGDNRFWIVNHATVVYRKEAVDRAGGYNVEFKRKQDIDLWKRMFADGSTFRNLSAVLYAWRRYG